MRASVEQASLWEHRCSDGRPRPSSHVHLAFFANSVARVRIHSSVLNSGVTAPRLLCVPPRLNAFHPKLRPDKRFNPLHSRQAQAQQPAFLLNIKMKIKKRATLPLCDYPLGEFRQRHIDWSELEFITVLDFHCFLPRCQQFSRQLQVALALGPIQCKEVAEKMTLRAHGSSLCPRRRPRPRSYIANSQY